MMILTDQYFGDLGFIFMTDMKIKYFSRVMIDCCPLIYCAVKTKQHCEGIAEL